MHINDKTLSFGSYDEHFKIRINIWRSAHINTVNYLGPTAVQSVRKLENIIYKIFLSK